MPLHSQLTAGPCDFPLWVVLSDGRQGFRVEDLAALVFPCSMENHSVQPIVRNYQGTHINTKTHTDKHKSLVYCSVPAWWTMQRHVHSVHSIFLQLMKSYSWVNVMFKENYLMFKSYYDRHICLYLT